MADILPGHQYDRSLNRYRDTSTGKFVARTRINSLMEQQVAGAEDRLAHIMLGVYNKSIAPSMAQELMSDELRRVTLISNALGKGGINQLTFRDFGRAGNQLRDTYQRLTNLITGVETGKVTLPQAMNRLQGYVSEARQQFFAAQRDAQQASGRQWEERRVLNAKESCDQCIEYASMGWQPLGVLPLIGQGGTECGQFCRCTLESREVERATEDARQRV